MASTKPDDKTQTVRLTRGKTTSGTQVFDNADATEPGFARNVYVEKWADAAMGNPAAVELTIKPVEP